MEVKRKVLSYITKEDKDGMKILVFEQKDHPEAGLQIPGGTIEEGELLIDALYREIYEETGLAREELMLAGKVNKKNYFPPHRNETVYERNFFHLIYTGTGPEEWEHRVKSTGEDDGLLFICKWLPVEGLPELSAGLDEAIDLM